MGRVLWAPKLAMALMAFAAAPILGFVRADVVASRPDDALALPHLQHVTTGVMFLGFSAVFSAIVLAIARILGPFRDGRGTLQQATTGHRCRPSSCRSRSARWSR